MEEKKVRTLDNEIEDLLSYIESLNPETEEYKKVRENLENLYKLKIEEEKNINDRNDNKIFKFLGYGIEIGGIVLPLVFYGKWMKTGFKFEETGTYCSKTFMNLQKFFSPKRR